MRVVGDVPDVSADMSGGTSGGVSGGFKICMYGKSGGFASRPSGQPKIPNKIIICPEVYFRVLAKMWGSREFSRDVTRISRETRGCHVRCVYSATRDYSAMLRWAAVSFASPSPLSHQRRAPTSLPTTSRSLGTLRDRSLRCARYFLRKAAPMLTGSFEQTFIVTRGIFHQSTSH
jgi:hypothetical protein